MSLQSLRGASHPNQGYVCLPCRLQCAPVSFQRALRKRLVHSKLVEPTKEASLATTLKDQPLSTLMQALVAENPKEKPKVELPGVKLRKHFSTVKPLNFASWNADQKVDERSDGKKLSTDPGQSNDTPVQKLLRKQRCGTEPSHKFHQEKRSTPENGSISLSLPNVAQKSAKGKTLNPSSGVILKRKNAKGEIKSGTATKRGSTAVKVRRLRGSIVPAKPRATLQASQNRVTSEESLNRDTNKIHSVPVGKETVHNSFETRDVFKDVSQIFEGEHSSKSHSNDPSGLQDTLAAAERIEAAASRIIAPTTGSERKKSRKPRNAETMSDMDDDISSIKESKNQVITINSKQLQLNSLKIDQPSVPTLSHGLERVLFNPGVYQLQDLRSRVFNFDPYLQTIMPVRDFDFNLLKEYVTSSGDESLGELAQKHKRRYVGSSSSITGVLSHFHYLLSQWREINVGMLSKDFPDRNLRSFTLLQRCPSAIFLRWKNGFYAIDADKEFASANVLSMLGKSMEKLLTLDTQGFERYRKSSVNQVSIEEKNAPESYQYSTIGDFLIRAQLDAYDPRLPGTGTFDLKTRAVVTVRMDTENYLDGIGYEIKSHHGEFESYEREYFDMIRAAFLKYSLQARIGQMDGIFVAFHNVERIFGFQYVTLSEMDMAVHSHRDTMFGDQEFRLSLNLMNKVLDTATKKYPNTSLRIHIETRETQTNFMYIFAEPVTEEQVEEIQSRNDAKIAEFEQSIFSLEADKPQKNEAEWADIEASVQEEDKISLTNPGESETGDGPVISEEEPNVSRGDIEQAFEKGLDHEHVIEENKPPVNDFIIGGRLSDASSITQDGGGTGSNTEKTHKKETQDLLSEKLAERVGWGANQGADLPRDTGIGSIEEGVPETIPLEPIKSSAVGTVSTEYKEEHYEDSNQDEDHQQGHARSASQQENINVATSEVQTHKPELDSQSLHESQTQADNIDLEQINVAEKSNSKADITFLESIETEPMPDELDVFAMILTIRNIVNGSHTIRPEGLKPEDTWEVECSLSEVPDQRRASLLYKACRTRRKKHLDEARSTEKDSPYFRTLKKMSQEGAFWRKKIDTEDKDKPKYVLTDSVVKQKGKEAEDD